MYRSIIPPQKNHSSPSLSHHHLSRTLSGALGSSSLGGSTASTAAARAVAAGSLGGNRGSGVGSGVGSGNRGSAVGGSGGRGDQSGKGRGSSSGSSSSRGLGSRATAAGSGSLARVVRRIAASAVTVGSLASKVGSVVLAAAGPDLGAGSGVAGGSRVVEVDEKTGLRSVVSTGELDGVGRSAGTRALNGELGAADVELSTTLASGGVESHVLGSHEVSTGGKLVGEGEGEVVDALVVDVGSPLETSIGDGASGQFIDLEPVTVTKVVRSLSAGGSLAHVDGKGTGVTNLDVDGEANLVTGSDGVGLGLGPDVGIETTGVADNVLGGDILDGRVGVGRLTDVLVGLGGLAVDDEGLEVVVGKDAGEGGSDGQDGGERGTHVACL